MGKRHVSAIAPSAMVLSIAMVGFLPLAHAKARAWPRAVFHEHLGAFPTHMLRRLAVRQFRDLTWDTRTMTQPQAGLARNYTFLVTTFDPERGRKYLGDRDALSRRQLLFASVISDLPALHLRRAEWSLGKPKMRNGTFFDLGYILSARPDNVVANSSGDTAFSIGKPYPKTLRTLRERIFRTYPSSKIQVPSDHPDQWPGYKWQRVGPFEPKAILDRTGERNNEVLLHGTYGASKVEPAALLIRVDPLTHKDLVPADKLVPYLEDARQRNIPVVRIPAQRFLHQWVQAEQYAHYQQVLLRELERAFYSRQPTHDWHKELWQ